MLLPHVDSQLQTVLIYAAYLQAIIMQPTSRRPYESLYLICDSEHTPIDAIIKSVQLDAPVAIQCVRLVNNSGAVVNLRGPNNGNNLYIFLFERLSSLRWLNELAHDANSTPNPKIILLLDDTAPMDALEAAANHTLHQLNRYILIRPNGEMKPRLPNVVQSLYDRVPSAGRLPDPVHMLVHFRMHFGMFFAMGDAANSSEIIGVDALMARIVARQFHVGAELCSDATPGAMFFKGLGAIPRYNSRPKTHRLFNTRILTYQPSKRLALNL